MLRQLVNVLAELRKYRYDVGKVVKTPTNGGFFKMFGSFLSQRVILITVFSVLLSACGGDEHIQVLSDTGF